MEQHCPILQITGYKNSGKTTLMNKLIAEAAKKHWKTAAIKHHGHGGKPTTEAAEKDSHHHLKAGAMAAAVEGEGSLYVQINKSSWTLSDIIQLYRPLSPDVIFVEGFKQEDYQKVVLLRDHHDIDLLYELSNISCAITWKSLEKEVSVSFPIYFLEEETEYVNYIWTKVERFHEQ